MLLAACVPPEAVDATSARAAPTRTAAPVMRALMGDTPKRIVMRIASPGSPGGRSGRGTRRRSLAYTTWPQFGTLAYDFRVVKTTWSRVFCIHGPVRQSEPTL